MKISNPIKGFVNAYVSKGHVTQYLYENVELYSALNVGLTKGHNGIDIVAPWGTPIYAVEEGMVCDVKDNPSGYGMYVRTLTENHDTGDTNREWTYGHLSSITVKLGQKIKRGEEIGKMGNTGFVVSSASKNALGFWDRGGNKYDGTHLHLGCREFKFDKKGWKFNDVSPAITILNYDNGSLGSIDFKDYFQDGQTGDMEILKRELEKEADAPWYINFIKSLKFFGFK